MSPPHANLARLDLSFLCSPLGHFHQLQQPNNPGALIISLPHRSSVLKFTTELSKSKVCNLWKRRRNRCLGNILTGHPNSHPSLRSGQAFFSPPLAPSPLSQQYKHLGTRLTRVFLSSVPPILTAGSRQRHSGRGLSVPSLESVLIAGCGGLRAHRRAVPGEDRAASPIQLPLSARHPHLCLGTPPPWTSLAPELRRRTDGRRCLPGCSAALSTRATDTELPRLRSSAPTPPRHFHVTDTPPPIQTRDCVESVFAR